MKSFLKLFAVAGLLLSLSACSSSTDEIPGKSVPSSDGDKVVITQISDDDVSKMIEDGNANFNEFSPVLEGDTITFFTSGSSSCKPSPVAAKVEVDAIKVAFFTYPEDTQCTEDFGIYGWQIKFEEITPSPGVPYLRCQADVCYNDQTGDELSW